MAQLYEILLESAAAQIAAALRLVLNAAEAGRNALLFCKVSGPSRMRAQCNREQFPLHGIDFGPDADLM